MNKQERAPNLFSVLYTISILAVICILVIFSPDFDINDFNLANYSLEDFCVISMFLIPNSISITLFSIWGLVHYKRGKFIYFTFGLIFSIIVVAGIVGFYNLMTFAAESET